MKYCVIKDTDQKAFEDTINSLIASGWQPFGSVSVSSDDEWDVLAQALIFKDETD